LDTDLDHVGGCMANHSKFIKLLLSFVIAISPIFIINNAYAGAAEKWEYDVIPDQSQTLKIKGHKVDQYGAAVNDYDYNTKIDPKTPANRTKMGTVGMGRLLKVTGWGLLGAAALEALLDSVGWIMDPESQSIWRNKKTPPGSVGCVVVSGSGGKILQFVTGDINPVSIEPTPCPIDAAQKVIAKLQSQFPTWKFEFAGWISYPTNIVPGTRLDFNVKTTIPENSPSLNFYSIKAELAPESEQKPQEKEVLTPEALADYANHTHPDYSNPELAPKLEPKYSPEIQTDLWKPSNPWEDANSPTVQEVKKKLDEAPPEPKTDPEVTPNPDTGGLKIPPFCTYAAPVCEFIKDIKDVFKDEPLDDTALDIQPDNTQEIDTQVSFSSQCPAPINLANFSYHGISQSWTVDFSKFCYVFATYLKPVVISIGAFSAVLIVSGVGVRENG